MIRIGIDPGQTGAIAICRDGKISAVYDMPVMARVHGGGQEINTAELAGIIGRHIGQGLDGGAEAFLEAVSAMPGQGVSAMFRFGESFGAVKGVLGALGIRYGLITPPRWKKHYGLLGKDKDAARSLAITRHPEVADQLRRKKDVGRADAILIAAFQTT